MSSELAFLFQHPLVLQAAWLRVQDWYRQMWSPESELAQWRLEPERHLAELGKLLASGDYSPEPFPLLPHPKPGGRLRHFCMPSVRDQVAFAVLGCLLAPLIEGAIPNFSLGNRTYRRAARRWRSVSEVANYHKFDAPEDAPGEGKRKVWDSLPFSLADTRMYQPYRRAHGLFRRIIHWSAAALTKSKINEGKATDGALRPSDYPWNHVSPFTNRKWWTGRSSGRTRGYWARLDLQLAFPSANLEYLDLQLREILSEPLQKEIASSRRAEWISRFGRTSWDDALKEYPEELREQLKKPSVQNELRETLIRWLSQVRYEPLPTDSQEGGLSDLWRPPHSEQRLPFGTGEGHPGIPTGLAISGLLLNAYLNHFDQRMLHAALKGRENGRPFAVFRFVDDIVLLAPSPDVLAEAIDQAWSGIAGKESSLATRVSSEIPSNLRVNWEKVGPDSLAQLLSKYLEDSWYGSEPPPAEKAAGKDGKCPGCGLILPPPLDTRLRRAPPTFQKWMRAQKKKVKKREEERKAGTSSPDDPSADAFSHRFRQFRLDAVRRNRLGPFVTYLVERLSALGNDGLANRFGTGARNRLIDLHELCRFDFNDEEVKTETRLSFAANQLARAWLEEETLEGDRLQLREIRQSVRHAVQNAPAKFQLWRSVIRVALRRPIGGKDAASAETDRAEARRWLRGMLQLISHEKVADDGVKGLERFPEVRALSNCWSNTPGTGFSEQDIERRQQEIVRLYYSFLRTAFWRYLAEELLYLWRVRSFDESSAEALEAAPAWSSQSWLFRALPEQELSHAQEWLARLDDWVLLRREPEKPPLGGWELDAMVLATLSALPRRKLLEFTRKPSGGRGTNASEAPLHPIALPNVAGVFRGNLLVLDRLHTGRRLLAVKEFLPLRRLLPLLALSGVEPGDEKDLVEALRRNAALRDGPLGFHEVLKNLGLELDLPAARLTEWGKEARELVKRLSAEPEAAAEPFAVYRRYRLTFRHALRRLPARPGARRRETLHRLLWGDLWRVERLSQARIQPEVAPRVGLPTRVALKLFLDALDSRSDALDALHAADETRFHPPVWVIEEQASRFLAWGRHRQLLGGAAPSPVKTPRASRPWVEVSDEESAWEVLPNPVLFWPRAHGLEMSRLGYQLWCHTLLFMTACDGHESMLDTLARRGATPSAINENWKIRNRIHLPEEFWKILDQIIRQALLNPKRYREQELSLVSELKLQLQRLLKPRLSLDDFFWERVDVVLNDHDAQEAPRHVSRFSLNKPSHPPRQMTLRAEGLEEDLCIRMGQLAATYSSKAYYQRFPRSVPREEIQAIMREVNTAMSAPSSAPANSTPETPAPRLRTPELVILPEGILPSGELRELERLVALERRAVLCGEMFKPVPPVSPTRRHDANPRWLVNEACLLFPVQVSGDGGLPLVRRFSIHKPMPTHLEFGLATALSERKDARGRKGTEWKVLAGQRWYRFINHRWGDFTVAICSDLIDPSPWWSLRSQVLHIFMCAYNQDVDLFESMSWVRAYENYCNLVSVNHGEHGGSFAWTPGRSHSRELAKLRGSGLFLLADVLIPVKGLHEAQIRGTEWARDAAAKHWSGAKESKNRFKAPPPTFPSRK